MNLSNYISAMVAVLVVSSCGGNKRSEAASSVSADTVAVEVEKVNIEALPDTAYPSVSNIKYNTRIIDSVSGNIDNLNSLYTDTPGFFTFRGNALRNADFNGVLDSVPSDIVIDWEFITDTDYRETKFGRWGGGSGWTGQPLYVEWPDSSVNIFKKAGVVNGYFGRREIIVGSLASRVYFINYETGKASRPSVDVFNPIKGTVSLDPTLNGNLYVGQGVPNVRPFGAMVVDLYKHSVRDFFGEDSGAPRSWGAYDSSPVRVGQFLFRPGENGMIYKFRVLPGQLKLHSTMSYRVGGSAPGIESSMSVYANYGFTADNHGNIICTNLNVMKPVWHYSLGDDTDATPVIEIEDGHPYIYIGCEIDRQNVGTARFVKLDAIDGSEVWRAEIPGQRHETDSKHFDGGFYATALPGRGDASDLIFSNCVSNQPASSGNFVAIDRKTGKLVYSLRLKHYAWSSPVGFLTRDGRQIVVTADCAGNVYLIDAKAGKIIKTKHIGNNFESTPVVVGNTLVVGSRGRSIYKLSLR